MKIQNGKSQTFSYVENGVLNLILKRLPSDSYDNCIKFHYIDNKEVYIFAIFDAKKKKFEIHQSYIM